MGGIKAAPGVQIPPSPPGRSEVPGFRDLLCAPCGSPRSPTSRESVTRPPKGGLLQGIQSRAAKSREPRQVRKEATVSGSFRAPRGRWVPCRGPPDFVFPREVFCLSPLPPNLLLLPMELLPRDEDRLWALPVYGVVVESFERGLFTRSRYRRELFLVDALGGRVETLEGQTREELERRVRPPEERWSPSVLPPVLGEAQALRRAEAWRGEEDASIWGRLLRHTRTFGVPDSVRLWHRLYLERGKDEVWDSFSGRRVPSGALWLLALGQGEPSPEEPQD